MDNSFFSEDQQFLQFFPVPTLMMQIFRADSPTQEWTQQYFTWNNTPLESRLLLLYNYYYAHPRKSVLENTRENTDEFNWLKAFSFIIQNVLVCEESSISWSL